MSTATIIDQLATPTAVIGFGVTTLLLLGTTFYYYINKSKNGDTRNNSSSSSSTMNGHGAESIVKELDRMVRLSVLFLLRPLFVSIFRLPSRVRSI